MDGIRSFKPIPLSTLTLSSVLRLINFATSEKSGTQIRTKGHRMRSENAIHCATWPLNLFLNLSKKKVGFMELAANLCLYYVPFPCSTLYSLGNMPIKGYNRIANNSDNSCLISLIIGITLEL